MGTYDGYEESDISLCQAVADEIGLSLQHHLNTVKSLKERDDCITVCWEGSREAGPIYAICGGSIHDPADSEGETVTHY
jgi:hypothetical protein